MGKDQIIQIILTLRHLAFILGITVGRGIFARSLGPKLTPAKARILYFFKGDVSNTQFIAFKYKFILIATGEAIPLRGLEGVPGLPGAPQEIYP